MIATAVHPYLTNAEILEIVDPLTQPAAIVRWFKNNGYTVKVRPNGMPLVTRQHFEQVTGGNAEPIKSVGEEPDVSGYLKRLSNKSKKGAVV